MSDLTPPQSALLRNRSTAFLMTPENTEVFAWYGQAVAIAQSLESALITYLTFLQPRTQLARVNPKQLRHNLTTANLGALQRELAKHEEFRNAARNLAPLNDLRIELVHYWFTNPERQAKLTTVEGRAELVAELQRATDRIGPATAVVLGIAMLAAFPLPADKAVLVAPESDARR